MKKETKMNNKGFSLVELIIVIAIMAILVGVLAPQLLKYIEKTNVSSDVQLADTVKSAVQTAIMDPAVLADATAVTSIATFNAGAGISSLDGATDAFAAAVWETLGVANSTELRSRIKSHVNTAATNYAHVITVTISTSNQVTVSIPGTDSTGKKGNAASPISVR